jgi:uncharacterized protein DUF6249
MPAEGVVFVFIVAIAATIMIIALIFRFKQRELRHKERMVALEKGAELPVEKAERPPAPWSPRVYLLRGLIWLFTGMGLSVFLFGLSLSIVSRPERLEDRMWHAQRLRQSGATEDEIKQYLSQSQGQNVPRNEFPAGFALIGLIPMGVGLAYLIYYQGESKNASEVS